MHAACKAPESALPLARLACNSPGMADIINFDPSPQDDPPIVLRFTDERVELDAETSALVRQICRQTGQDEQTIVEACFRHFIEAARLPRVFRPDEPGSLDYDIAQLKAKAQALGQADHAPPTLDEQLDTIKAHVRDLRSSFTHHKGEHDGGIPEPEILREIECLEATLKLLTRWKAANPS